MSVVATMGKYQKWCQDNELTQKLQKKLQEQMQTSSSLMKQKESALTEKDELQKKIGDLQQELDLLQLKGHKKVSGQCDKTITQSGMLWSCFNA